MKIPDKTNPCSIYPVADVAHQHGSPVGEQPENHVSARHHAEGYKHQRGLYATGYFTKEDQPNYTQ